MSGGSVDGTRAFRHHAPLLSVFALLLAPLAASAQAPADDLVTGVVVDAQGRPVAGAKVGTAFRLAATFAATETVISYGQPAVLTDSKGAFSIPAAPIRYTKVLVAAGADGSLGFTVRVPGAPAQIQLLPSARLELEIVKSFGAKTAISFDLVAGGSAVGYGGMSAPKNAFVVPAGALEVHAQNTESLTSVSKLTLAASKTSQLKVALHPTAWALNVGKPAPAFTPTDVHNLPAGQLSDHLRGKWVLVDFWAKWCLPCIEEMPKIIAFYESHAQLRERFEIVAVHAPDAANFAAIQSDYDNLVKRAWGGKPMPFPLVFDSTGQSQKRWGIEVYPTNLLIDPEGALVGLSSVEDLASRMGKQGTTNGR